MDRKRDSTVTCANILIKNGHSAAVSAVVGFLKTGQFGAQNHISRPARLEFGDHFRLDFHGRLNSNRIAIYLMALVWGSCLSEFSEGGEIPHWISDSLPLADPKKL